MSMMFEFHDNVVVKKTSRKAGKTLKDKKMDEVMQKINTFTADQKKAFDILVDDNENWIYYLGAAGTGKSYSLETYVEFARSIQNKWVSVCATTGCAARLIDACTVHKFFGFPCDVLYDESGKPKTKSNKKIWKSDVIIIDEISMARADLLSAVISSIKASDKKRAKIGKDPIKLIICGDPCQLPAIMSPEDKAEIERRLEKRLGKFDVGEGWFFDAPEWDEIGFKCIELKEIMRQKGNAELTENLNRIRLGDGSWTHWFNENCSLEVDNPPEDAIRLFPYNRQVRDYNEKKINSMEGELKVYTAELDGVTAKEVEDNGFDYELKLKPGCLVMIKSNAYEGAEWCELMGIDSKYWNEYFGNGTTGIYRGTLEDAKGEYLCIDIPDAKEGRYHYLKLYKRVFDTYDYVEVNGGMKKVRTGNTFRCYPCVLSFSVSVHKSQGSSLSSVVLDPKSFASGMLYVALSRVKSSNPKDIYLTRMIEPQDAILSNEVKEFLKQICENS